MLEREVGVRPSRATPVNGGARSAVGPAVAGDGGGIGPTVGATDEDDVTVLLAAGQRGRVRATGDGIRMLLTAKEVEAALQLGRTRTYQLLRSGEIPVLRVGRVLRISRLALEQWVAERSGSRTA